MVALHPIQMVHFQLFHLNIKSIKDRNLPIQWRVTLPDKNVDVVVTAHNPDAWMELSIPYWEGPVNVFRQPYRAWIFRDDWL